MRTVLLALTVATLTACTTVPDRFRDDPRLAGRSPAYQEGFFDGVRSGRHLTGHYLTFHTLDVQRYRSDAAYRRGWETGVRAAIEAGS